MSKMAFCPSDPGDRESSPVKAIVQPLKISNFFVRVVGDR